MRIITYLCCFLVLAISHAAQASLTSFDTRHLLIDYTKTKSSPVRSKSSYSKYTKVWFIGHSSDDIFGLGANKPMTANLSCDNASYPLTSADPARGTVITTTCLGITYYGYSACNNGWHLNNHNCEVNDCKGFYDGSSYMSNCANVENCFFGAKENFICRQCQEGYTLSRGICIKAVCDLSEYPYTSDPGTTAGIQKMPCKTGDEYRYGYLSCNTGWDKSGSYCNIHPCDTSEYPYTTSPSSSLGTVVSCNTGGTMRYAYTGCKEDYVLNNGRCEEACSYTLTSKPSGCESVPSCTKNGKTYYSSADCTACREGYYLYSGRCYKNRCDGYPYFYYARALEDCKTYSSCQMGDDNIYKCDSCPAGKILERGLCFTPPTGSFEIVINDSWDVFTSGPTILDCGNGKITASDGGYMSCSISNLSHVKITGAPASIISYDGESVIDIISLNLSSVQVYSDLFSGAKNLTIDISHLELPSGLKRGWKMFYNCRGLTGTIPTLPSHLEDGRYMFSYTQNLSGTCPTKPESLTSTEGMYFASGVSCDYGSE